LSIYFADTSAFAKRYIREDGSNWIRELFIPESDNQIILAELGLVEFISLLSRRKREMNVSIEDFDGLKKQFFWDILNRYRVLKTNTRVYNRARILLPKHPLRTLDALQLASAILVRDALRQPITFLSADTRLLDIAEAEDFIVEDPNQHTEE
jgi:predicted nucleic acid-binding protein